MGTTMAHDERRQGKSDTMSDPETRFGAGEKPRNLREWHAFGKQTLALFPAGADRHPPTIKKMVTELSIPKECVYRAVAFARSFSDVELEVLCALQTPAGNPLTFSHVRAVISVEDPKKRAVLLKRAASEGWTHDVLARATVEVTGSRKHHGGKPPSRPRTPDAALMQIAKYTEEWLSRYEKAWDDSKSPLGTADNMRPKEVRALKDPLAQARKAVKQLGEAARSLDTKLEKMAAKIEKLETEGAASQSGSGSKKANKPSGARR
jgi:hypothetical protein